MKYSRCYEFLKVGTFSWLIWYANRHSNHGIVAENISVNVSSSFTSEGKRMQMHTVTVLVIALLSGLLDERTALHTVKPSRKSFSHFYVSMKWAHTNAFPTRLIFCNLVKKLDRA